MPTSPRSTPPRSSVSRRWPANGGIRPAKFAPLHRFNPVRHRLHPRRRRSPISAARRAIRHALRGLTLLDIGCGGGLAQRADGAAGRSVTGIDAAPPTSRIADLHARGQGLSIDYRQDDRRERSPMPARAIRRRTEDGNGRARRRCRLFLRRLCEAGRARRPDVRRRSTAPSRPGAGQSRRGILLGWLPRGTHEWSRFLTPFD